MAKKSQALKDAEEQIEKLKESVVHEVQNTERAMKAVRQEYEPYIKQVEYFLQIVERSNLPEFVRTEAGRLLAESIKLRP